MIRSRLKNTRSRSRKLYAAPLPAPKRKYTLPNLTFIQVPELYYFGPLELEPHGKKVRSRSCMGQKNSGVVDIRRYLQISEDIICRYSRDFLNFNKGPKIQNRQTHKLLPISSPPNEVVERLLFVHSVHLSENTFTGQSKVFFLI